MTVLQRMPEVLIIQLVRFSNFRNGYSPDKISALVDFDLEAADFSEFSGCKDDVYDLVGVCNHFGVLGGGHYVAYVCRDVTDSRPGSDWVELDDGVALPIEKKHVVSSAAYILFYRRRQEV